MVVLINEKLCRGTTTTVNQMVKPDDNIGGRKRILARNCAELMLSAKQIIQTKVFFILNVKCLASMIRL